MGKLEITIATGLMAFSLSACASGAKEAPQDFAEFEQPTFWGKTEASYAKVQPESSASLWTTAPNALLGMRRAKDVGDLLTVTVDMNDQASLQTSLSRNRQTNEQFNLSAPLRTASSGR